MIFFFSSRRRHTRCSRDWSSDVCSSDLYIPTSTAGNGTSGRTNTGTRMNISGPRIGWPARTRDTSQVVVRPKTIDFEEVYPGLSHPILLTITGVKGALVKGTIRPVESWIVLDQTASDGMSTP